MPQKQEGLKSLGVGAPNSKIGVLAKQSWCSRGWSLTKVQVGAWQLIVTIYILYLFYCIVYINKSIYSCCSSCVLNIYVLTGKTIVGKRNIDSPPLSISNKYHSQSYTRTIQMYMKFLFPIREYQYRRSYQLFLQYVKALLTFFIPFKSDIFLQQFLYRCSNLSLSFDKISVIPCTSQCSTKLSCCLWWR